MKKLTPAVILLLPLLATQASTAELKAGTGSRPAITAVLPNNGGTAGGTAVDIFGSGFTGVSGVKFGGIPAASVTLVTDGHLQVPSSPAGTSKVDVTVVTAAGASAPVAADQFSYADWTQSWHASSVLDDNGVYLGGTELRNLAWALTRRSVNGGAGGILPGTAGARHCTTSSPNYSAAKDACVSLLEGVGYWRETNCPKPSQGPQINALNSPGGHWNQDVELDHGGRWNCSGFDVVNSLFTLTFSIDGRGAAINPPLQVPVASGVAGAYVYARDDIDGTWRRTTITGATGANRSLGEHVDNAMRSGSRDLLLVGNDGASPYHGTFSTSPWGFTISDRPEPWSQSAVAVAPWTTSNSTITLAETCPTAISGAAVYDATISQTIGVESSCVGNLLTLAANAAYASSTFADSILFKPGSCTDGTTGVCTNTATDWDVTKAASSVTSDGASPNSHVTITWTGALYAAPATTWTVNGRGVAVGAGGSGASNANVTGVAATSARTTSVTFVATGVVNCGSGCTGGVVTMMPPRHPGCGLVINCSLVARVMAIVDCPDLGGTHRAYAIHGQELWQRVDGDTPFWKINSVKPASEAALRSPTGLRGLTCIPYQGGYQLLVLDQGANQRVWRINQNVGAGAGDSAGWTSETALPYGGINAYNDMTLVNNSVLFGEGDDHRKGTSFGFTGHPTWGALNANVVSGFYIRSRNTDVGPTYSFVPETNSAMYNAMLQVITPAVPNTLANCGEEMCSVMGATRALTLSQFPQDLNGAGQSQRLYFGGLDAGGRPLHNVAWLATVPFSTFGGVP